MFPISHDGLSSLSFIAFCKDASDPDLDLPNKLHLLQTAEGIRRAGHPDWFVLVGLLHDMGKIMFLWGTGEDGQDGYSPSGKRKFRLNNIPFSRERMKRVVVVDLLC